MADSIEAIQKSKKTYLAVFGALLLGTILTYCVAEFEILDFGDHGFDKVDAIIGICIAITKASLVALIFMHLNHEKKAIYWIFGAGLLFVSCLAFLFSLAYKNPIHDYLFYK